MVRRKKRLLLQPLLPFSANKTKISYTPDLLLTINYCFHSQLIKNKIINNSKNYECSTKFCSYVTTGRVFQIALRSREYFLQWREWKILLGEKFFLWSQQPQTKSEYLYTGIINTVFQIFTIFILHVSNRILIFVRKIDLFHIFHCFILSWICP